MPLGISLTPPRIDHPSKNEQKAQQHRESNIARGKIYLPKIYYSSIKIGLFL